METTKENDMITKQQAVWAVCKYAVKCANDRTPIDPEDLKNEIANTANEENSVSRQEVMRQVDKYIAKCKLLGIPLSSAGINTVIVQMPEESKEDDGREA